MKLACCGLDCQICPAFIALKNDDADLRARTADEWTQRYNHPFRPEDINCVGCRGEGIQVGHCSVCEIRSCCIRQDISDCGQCPQFACGKIENFFKFFPDGGAENRRRLTAVK
jgi:hypothetical protein